MYGGTNLCVCMLVCEGEQAPVCLCMWGAEIHVLCLQPLQLIVETKSFGESRASSPVQLD